MTEIDFHYTRDAARLTVRLVGLDAVELAEVIVGLFTRFEPISRQAVLAGLAQIAGAQSRAPLSTIAQAVRAAGPDPTTIELLEDFTS